MIVAIAIKVIGSIALVLCIQYFTALSRLGESLSKHGHSAQTLAYYSKLQLRRRFQHMSTGMTFYFLSFFLPRNVCSMLLLVATLLIFCIHTSKKPNVRQWYLDRFSSLLRPEEMKSLPGAWYFLLGSSFLSMFPPLDISRTCLLCLSFADPAAAIGGILLSNRNPSPKGGWYKTKTFSGSLCCFVATFIIVISQSPTMDIVEAIITALSCSILEGLICKIPILDDNLVIPLGTAATLWSYRYYPWIIK